MVRESTFYRHIPGFGVVHIGANSVRAKSVDGR